MNGKLTSNWNRFKMSPQLFYIIPLSSLTNCITCATHTIAHFSFANNSLQLYLSNFFCFCSRIFGFYSEICARKQIIEEKKTFENFIQAHKIVVNLGLASLVMHRYKSIDEM